MVVVAVESVGRHRSGHDDVGADRIERRKGLVLSGAQSLGHTDDAHHQADAGGEADRRHDRSTESSSQLIPCVTKGEQVDLPKLKAAKLFDH